MAENRDIQGLFKSPRHPYTRAVLDTLPRMDVRRRHRLPQIAGSPPDLIHWDGKCAYLERCPKALTVRRTDDEPPLVLVAGANPGHEAACYNPSALDSF